MSCATASIGCTIAVSTAAPATRDAAGYGALDFTEATSSGTGAVVGQTLTIPQFGGTSSPTTATPLATGEVCKSQGPIDWGQLALNALYVDDDAGHVILLSGLNGADKGKDLSFEITYPNGAIRYTAGHVSGYTETPGSAGDNIMMDATIELNYQPVNVAAQ